MLPSENTLSGLFNQGTQTGVGPHLVAGYSKKTFGMCLVEAFSYLLFLGKLPLPLHFCWILLLGCLGRPRLASGWRSFACCAICVYGLSWRCCRPS